MTIGETIESKVRGALHSEPNEETRMRRIRLQLMHDAFHRLEDVACDLADARKLAGSARANDGDGDAVGAAYDRLREKMARTGASRALVSALVLVLSTVRLSVGERAVIGELVVGLDQDEAAWLDALLVVLL